MLDIYITHTHGLFSALLEGLSNGLFFVLFFFTGDFFSAPF
jgi:hypothetical protein